MALIFPCILFTWHIGIKLVTKVLDLSLSLFFKGPPGYISNQTLVSYSLFSFFIFPAYTHRHNTTVGDGPKQSTSTS